MTPRPQLVLTIEERRSALWAKLSDHFEYRLSEMRKQNDSDKSDTDTANLRGRIAELKLIISLGVDPVKETSLTL